MNKSQYDKKNTEMSIRRAREKQYNLDDQRRFSVTQVTYEMDLNNKSEKVIQKVKAKVIQNVPGVLKKNKTDKSPGLV